MLLLLFPTFPTLRNEHLEKRKKKENNHDRIVHAAAAFLSLSSIFLRVSLTLGLFHAFFLALKVKKDMTEWHPRSSLYLAGIASIALFGPVFISCPLNLLDVYVIVWYNHLLSHNSQDALLFHIVPYIFIICQVNLLIRRRKVRKSCVRILIRLWQIQARFFPLHVCLNFSDILTQIP